MIQNKKIQNLKELEYYTNSNLVGELILQLQKKEPTNQTYRDMTHTYAQICLFVNDLITNQRFYEQSMEEYRGDKNRAIVRARKAEEKLKLLEAQVEKYKKVYG